MYDYREWVKVITLGWLFDELLVSNECEINVWLPTYREWVIGNIGIFFKKLLKGDEWFSKNNHVAVMLVLLQVDKSSNWNMKSFFREERNWADAFGKNSIFWFFGIIEKMEHVVVDDQTCH